MNLSAQDIVAAQKVFDAYLEYRKTPEEHVSYTQWFKKIRHQYTGGDMERSYLRNLCCTAIGQASAFNLISKVPSEITQEEIDAIKKTAKMLQSTLTEMMKTIQKGEKEMLVEPKEPNHG